MLKIDSINGKAIPANDPFRKCKKKIYLKLSSFRAVWKNLVERI
jgi:hypothetical protein